MLRVATIVEGHGEVAAVPILLRRMFAELCNRHDVDILRPIRERRGRLVKPDELCRAVQLAINKLRNPPHGDEPSLVLVLFDRDPSPELPCQMAPPLVALLKQQFSHQNTAVVLANVEYETWFVAAAESLTRYLKLQDQEVIPDDPEEKRLGKSWIKSRFRGPSYSETQDQPAMTAAMEFTKARERSPSFDKLCRVVESQ